jgi:uncharacterized membrane protein
MKRPILKLPYQTGDYLAEILALIGLIAQGVINDVVYPGLPQTIPTHVGFDGTANAYGDKATILIVPAGTIVLYLVLLLVSRFPQAFNLPIAITETNAERQYRNARAVALATRRIYSYIQLSNMGRAAIGKEYATGHRLAVPHRRTGRRVWDDRLFPAPHDHLALTM